MPGSNLSPERHEPLPNLLLLPVAGWRKLSRRGRRTLLALAALGAAALALAWPAVERGKREGDARRAEEATKQRLARRSALIADQRPRSAPIPPALGARMRAAGGLEGRRGAVLAAGPLESAIARDVRSRIAAGSLSGPLLGTDCRPVRNRTPKGAGYNCFALTGRDSFRGRDLDSGYRFSARAELGAGTLTWCKENPRPLHPTSYVTTVPISRKCR